MKKSYLVLVMFLALLIVLVGCSSDNSEQEPTVTPEVSKSQTESPTKEEPIEKPIVETKEYDQPMDPEVYSGELLKLLQSKHFTVTMDTGIDKDRQIMVYETMTVVDGDRSATSMRSMASTVIDLVTILEDGKAYVIKHNEETIVVTPIEKNAEKIGVTLDEIDFNDIEYLGKGKGLYVNQPADFEEYSIDQGFVRFYYDGSEFKAIEVITDEGVTLTNHHVFSEEVDESLFELPKDYKQVEN